MPEGPAAALLRLVREHAQLAPPAVRYNAGDHASIGNRAGAHVGGRPVGDEEHRLERHSRSHLGRKSIDQKPITRADAVLMAAVFEDCVCHVCAHRRALSSGSISPAHNGGTIEDITRQRSQGAAQWDGVGDGVELGDGEGPWTVAGAAPVSMTTSP